jgi:hypothetical protein
MAPPSTSSKTIEFHENPIVLNVYPNLFHPDGLINLESEEAKKMLTDWEAPQAFSKIGYARSLGGFFYQFFYAIIGAIILGLTYSTILGLLYPYPESKSYEGMAGVLFMFLQNLFNIPTGYAIERFIGEYRIKDPRKMIQYVRFYIWYQMFTGIVLVTTFSFFILHILQSDNPLIWAKWLMLITISREYPAMAGIFLANLKGLQKFDYESKLNFLNDTFIRPGFEVGFVLWGKYILGANPVYGELIGIAIGFAIGTYVDDFFSMGFAMLYFRKAIAPMGFTLTDCFIPHVERDVMVNSIKFGFVVAVPGLIGSFFGTITTLWWYTMVPGYLTLVALSRLADELANIVKRGGGINVKATISEAYNNKKIELTSYYVSMSWKFVMFFMFAIGSVVFSFIPLLLRVLLVAGGAENYVLAAAFIIPNIIATSIEEPIGTSENIILGANKPLVVTVVDIIGMGASFGLTYLYLFVWRIQDVYGFQGLIWLLPLGGFPIAFTRLIIFWRYIHKNICPVKFREFGWQAFVAPLIPSLILAGIAQLWQIFVFPPMVEAFGGTNLALIIAGTISILFAFIVCVMLIFFPLYTAFGGWDDNTLSIFHEAVEISGPSRFLFRPIDKVSQWLGLKSPLHNRFPIQYQKAKEEAIELMKERYIKDKLTTLIRENEDAFI